jgi:4-hydroxy-2-oxoheptanedioate aldolase
MALDAGAAGIVAPYVETAEQVRALHGAVKLRPIKGARLDAVLGGRARFEPELAAYQETHHGENILVINIESRPAMENMPALLAVEGVDAVLVGPHDLSSSLGLPERYEAPEFDAAIHTIAHAARTRGVGAGIHSWMGVAREIAWAEAGLNFFIHSADIIAMKQTLATEVRELRQALGEREQQAGQRAVNI